MNANTSVTDPLEDMVEAEECQERAEVTVEEGRNEGAVCPPSSPIHMKAVETPTFSLMYSTTKNKLLNQYY